MSKLRPATAGNVVGVGLLTRFSPAADGFLARASPGLPVRRPNPGLPLRGTGPGLTVRSPALPERSPALPERCARGGLEVLLGILGPSRAVKSTGGVGDAGRCDAEAFSDLSGARGLSTVQSSNALSPNLTIPSCPTSIASSCTSFLLAVDHSSGLAESPTWIDPSSPIQTASSSASFSFCTIEYSKVSSSTSFPFCTVEYSKVSSTSFPFCTVEYPEPG